ncbi:hypothetical protein EDB19DRAFT_1675688, partial [Suillus lakei]
WASKPIHDTYRQSGSFRAAQVASRQVFASRPTHAFVGFSDTSRIFSAPVTEFVTFTFKRGVSMDAVQPLVKKLQAKLQGTPKFYGSTRAPVLAKPNVGSRRVGMGECEGTLGCCKLGSLKEIIDEVKKIADLWLVHAILTRYNV